MGLFVLRFKLSSTAYRPLATLIEAGLAGAAPDQTKATHYPKESYVAEQTATVAESSQQNTGSGETLDAVLEKTNEVIPHEILSEERIGNSRIKYTVKIPAAEVESRTDEVLKEFQGDVTVPGFRKGKAPKNLVRARFGKAAKDEAVRKMMPRVAQLVAEAKDVHVLASPYYEGYKEDEDAAVATLVLEVRPEIKIEDSHLQGIEVEVTERPAGDEQVEAEVKALQERFANYEASEGAAFEENDALSYDVEVTTPEGDKLSHLSGKSKYSDDVAGEFSPTVVEKLKGAKKGDVVEVVDVEMGDGEPGDRPTVNYKFTINEVKKRILPALDDEFAKDVSPDFETFAQLRERIATNLKEREDARRREQTLGGIYAELSKRIDFEIPPSIVERLFNQSVNRTEKRYNEMGFSLRQMGKGYIDQFVRSTQEAAQRDAKVVLIADELARFMNIEVTEEAVSAEIEKIATLQGRKPLAIRAELEKNKALDRFQEDLRIKQMEDALIAKAVVKVVEEKSEEASDEAESQ